MNDWKENWYCPTEDDPLAGATLADLSDQLPGETDEEAWDRLGDISVSLAEPCVLPRDCLDVDC